MYCVDVHIQALVFMLLRAHYSSNFHQDMHGIHTLSGLVTWSSRFFDNLDPSKI